MRTADGAASLVGRSAELDRLTALAGVSAPARSGLVVVSGDAGIGKTRILQALVQKAERAGFRVTVGHCVNFGSSPLPYLPFSEALGRLAAASPERVDRLVQDYPALTRLAPRGRRPSEPVGDTVDRGELFESVQGSLAELGREGPLLMVIEDLHWADQSTYDLLSFLFARRFDSPVSIVVSYRSDDLNRRHPLRTVMAGWIRLPGVERLELKPLGEAAITQLVQQLQPAPLAPAQLRTVLDRAEGNAFFAEELVAATREGRAVVPPDLAGLLMDRIDQLDAPARQLVRAASAAGRIARHAVLTRVSGLSTEQFDDAVRGAVDLHVLVVEADGYAFRHALLAEAVYDDLLPGERVRLHTAYVQALTDTPGSGSTAELARHAIAAGDRAVALHASLRAGDDAAAVGGPDEALRHYELALDILAGPAVGEQVDRVEVVEKAAAAAIAAGRIQRAIAVVDEQLQRAVSETPLQRARLLILQAQSAMLTDSMLDTVAATAVALTLVPAEPLTPLRARAVAAHAIALSDRQRDEEAIRWAGEGLELASSLGLDDVTVQLRTLLARLRERDGDPVTSRRMLEQVLDQTRSAGDPAELRALFALAGLDFAAGDLEAAFTLYRLGADRARQLGRPYAPYGLDARALAALVAYQRGDWEAALELVDTHAESAPPLAEATLLSVRMAVHAGRGDPGGLHLLELVRPWWTVDGMIAVISAAAAIDLYGDSGRIDEAIAIHDDVVDTLAVQWEQRDFQARIRLSALLLGQLATASGQVTGTRRAEFTQRGAELVEAAELAMDTGRRRHHSGLESKIWLSRSRAEWLRLRWLSGVDTPERLDLVAAWQLCVDGFGDFGHQLEWSRSVARLAAASNHHPTPADTELTEAAVRTARRLGAAPLLAELGVSSATHRGTGDLLTGREMEVLLLVAEGRSNREIGQLLFISTKTASVHVSNILAKLTVASRTEAVSEARRRGLLP